MMSDDVTRRSDVGDGAVRARGASRLGGILSKACEPVSRVSLGTGLLLVAMTTAAFLAAWRPAGIDDSWITYRYARNIAAGHGFVYNLGEHVQGASTPLYTLLLAVIAWTFGSASIPAASYVLGWASFCVTVVLIHRTVAAASSPVAAWAGTFLIVTFYPLAWVSSIGMETPIYSALIFGAFYLFWRERLDAALVVGTFAALTRFEGLIVPSAVLAGAVVAYRRLPRVRAFAAAAVLYVTWVVFAYLYFGAVLPNSLAAKQSHFPGMGYSWWVIDFLRNHYIATGLAAGGGLAVLFSNPRLLPVVLWLPLYGLAYFVSGIRFYPWYVGPLCLALFLLGALGFGEVIRRGRTSTVGSFAIAGVGLGVVVFAVAPPEFKPRGYITLAEETALEDARYAAALQAAAHYGRAEKNVSRGIGMIGWFTDCYMIDTAGLVSPWLVRDYPDEYGADSFESAVAQYQPRFVFESLRSVPDSIQKHYVERVRVPSGTPRVGPFLLLERKSAAGDKEVVR